MGLSNYLPNSRISQSGVCTSSTRPASPYEGQLIYETDTDKVLVWNGSAWYANWNVAWGIMAYNSKTSTQSNISTETEIVNSGSFTAVSGRLYRLTYSAPRHYKSSGGGTVTWRIRKTNTSGTQYAGTLRTVGDTNQTGATLIVVTTLDSGSQSIIGSVASGTGLIASEPNSTNPAQIIVEDIGPA